jgi:undecaprenyl diphosphate synthase
MRQNIKQYIEDTKKNNMRISVIGDLTRLDADLQESIAYLQDLTKANAGLRVTLAINYGGRDDIVRAVRRIAAEAAVGRVKAENITDRLFSNYLDTADLPEPDLFIRTGGDLRVSNFLLWQFAYTEFYFCDKYWPDFEFKDLEKAVEEFGKRKRRFGGR